MGTITDVSTYTATVSFDPVIGASMLVILQGATPLAAYTYTNGAVFSPARTESMTMPVAGLNFMLSEIDKWIVVCGEKLPAPPFKLAQTTATHNVAPAAVSVTATVNSHAFSASWSEADGVVLPVRDAIDQPLNSFTDITNIYKRFRDNIPGAAPNPNTGPLTNAQLRQAPVEIEGNVQALGSLTDTELRATPVAVSGTVTANGPLTDTQLRATALPVSLASAPTTAVTGTFWPATQPVSLADPINVGNIPHVIVDSMPASGAGLTDSELRASAVPVSLASVPAHAVTGPLTDAQLRATPVPISGTVTITDGAGAVNVIVDSGSIDVTDDATRDLGKVDIASLDQYTPVSGRLPVDGSGVTQPISATSLPLPTGAATETTLAAGGTNKTLKRAVVALTTTADVIALVASRRLKVYQYALQSRNDSMTCQFRDGAAGSFLGLRWGLNAREGASGAAVDASRFLFATTASNALQAVISGTGTVDIEVSYWDDDTA